MRFFILLAVNLLLLSWTDNHRGHHVEAITCDGTCSGHGACDAATGYCRCFAGYIGTSCKQMSCPEGIAWADYATETDVAHDMAECSNMGLCDRTTGVCKCATGFEGVACERMACPSCTNGRCVSMREAAAIQDNTNFFVATTYTVWDADKIYGCQCDNGFFGYDCSLRECPKGDDPMTTTSIVNEVQQLSCLCNGCTGTFALTFRRRTTVNILPTATAATLKDALEKLDNIHGVTITISGGSATLCDADGATTSITFTHNPGDLPTLQLQNRLTGGTPAPVLTITSAPASGLYDAPSPAVDGTREEVFCSNRGTCDHSLGVCSCSVGFSSSNGAGAIGSLGDCGFGTTAACPTTSRGVCDGQGTCSGPPSYTCTCAAPFTGFDCTQQTCPQGIAWFDGATGPDTAHNLATCSNRGSCDRKTGRCICDSMFTGAACDVLKCPGATTTCNGHGTCKTMQQLALAASSNGDPLGVTYGNTFNVPATWDYNKIQGCDCTKDYYLGPYSGAFGEFHDYDCSTRHCPLGADPYETGKVNEKQTIVCTATGGYFALTFRQQTTGRILFDATAADVKTALEKLATIGSVEVVFSTGGTQVCDAGGAVSTYRLVCISRSHAIALGC